MIEGGIIRIFTRCDDFVDDDGSRTPIYTYKDYDIELLQKLWEAAEPLVSMYHLSPSNLQIAVEALRPLCGDDTNGE